MSETVIQEIADFEVGLPEGWQAMPLGADAPVTWADQLAAHLVPADEVAQRSLAMSLSAAQAQFTAMDDPRLRSAVWVPYPQTGTASAAMIFLLADRRAIGSPDEHEAFLASYAQRDDLEESYYSVSTFRSDIDAGVVVGSHNLVAHPGTTPDEAELEERVVITVFPPNSVEVVQFVFSAQGLGSFTNMPQQCFDFVSTLDVTLEAAR